MTFIPDVVQLAMNGSLTLTVSTEPPEAPEPEPPRLKPLVRWMTGPLAP